MYARITTLQSTPDHIPDVEHYLEDAILPVLRLQPGFKCLVVLRNADDKVVTITFWATEADEQATFSREYLRDVLDDKAVLLLHSSRSETYQVLLASDVA